MKSTRLADPGGTMIETRGRRHHHGAGLGHGDEVSQMHQRKRGFPRHQDQLAPLLQGDVGRALHQRPAGAARDGRDGGHRTGTDRPCRRYAGSRRPAWRPGRRRERGTPSPVSTGGLLQPLQRLDVALFPQQPHAMLGRRSARPAPDRGPAPRASERRRARPRRR